ncbi:MAG: LysM peptidoglycan-binding domain-containing protein [Flavobacteriales bacterium]|nr:LysM peptidoglycan-binding domain-containing protein [Flavobacteriales bacterium]
MKFNFFSTLLLLLWSLKLFSQKDSISDNKNETFSNRTIASLDSIKKNWLYLSNNVSANYNPNVVIKSSAYYLHHLNQLNLPFPLIVNDRVLYFINLLVNENHSTTSYIVELGEKYAGTLEKTLKKKNLPLELKYLPTVLSSNNNLFVSASGSVGLWQLLYPQARLYKLNVSSIIDERKDIKKSTEAATAYLKDLYELYNDWPMAITAYSCSPAILNKAIRRSGGKMNLENMYSYLPPDSRDTYYAFMASLYVHNYKEECKMKNIKIEFPAKTDSLITERNLSLKAIAIKMNIPLNKLQFLNPTYRADIIPTQHILYLPLGTISFFNSIKDSIYVYQDSTLYKPISTVIENNNKLNSANENLKSTSSVGSEEKVYYKVKSGDNLGYIATLYNIKVSDIQRWNNISGTRINVGQSLVVYVPKAKADTYKHVNEMSTYQKDKIIEKNTSSEEEIEILPDESKWHIYIVKSGDNLFNIAKKYPGVSAEKIMEINNITEDIQPGQKLKIKRK